MKATQGSAHAVAITFANTSVVTKGVSMFTPRLALMRPFLSSADDAKATSVNTADVDLPKNLH